jgi:hypothetical protein
MKMIEMVGSTTKKGRVRSENITTVGVGVRVTTLPYQMKASLGFI